jgi:PAS domain S-box-containing protein
VKSLEWEGKEDTGIRFLDGASSSDLFWKNFNHQQLAMALTDEQGHVLVSNPLFTKTVIQSPSQADLFFILENLRKEGHSFKEPVSVPYNAAHHMVLLTLFKVPENSGTASYLWVATSQAEVVLQQKVSNLKNLYRSFIDTSFELIFRTTLSGTILFANRLFLRSFGFENYRKIKGSTIQLLFNDPSYYEQLQKQLLENKRVSSETVLFRCVDGTVLTALVNCHLYHDESGVAVLNWTMLDISHQVESENALKANNDQLAKVNRQMEKFLYSTSHDLRSPITSILGLINLMRLESKDVSMLDYVAKIEASTMKLDNVIRDIMSFSRATYQRLTSQRIDFSHMTWKIINSHRSEPAVKKINFEVKTDDLFPFYGDGGRIEIVVENIVRNAIQFYDENKSRPFIQVNISTDKRSVQMEIIDNGIGIGQQHMEHIFDMFYKASHHSKGAGLGLYIVKETVEKLQGTIVAESEIGFGTVFRISIPNDHKGRLISRKLQLQNNN